MNTPLLTLAMISAYALSACQPAAPPAAEPPMTEAPAAAEPADVAPATGDVVDGAMGSPDHTTLVAAIQAAGLVDTLKGPGPFTVFAPTNAAFDALPPGTVDGLLEPESQGDLSNLLTYHVVPGRVDAATLTQQIQAGNGSATLTTVAGATLTARADAGSVTVTDAQGNVANVIAADLRQSNGVIHVIDKVLMP